jgi:hypothetical protein
MTYHVSHDATQLASRFEFRASCCNYTYIIVFINLHRYMGHDWTPLALAVSAWQCLCMVWVLLA